MNYTDKWQSIVEYFDEEGTKIEIKTQTELKKNKIIKKIKEINHERKKVYYRYVLKRNNTEQLKLF